MTAISVILPVYNVAPYISACIDSLKQQRFQDLEFIFVDDCSMDDSMAFVEKFAETDPRVRILRNGENLGPGPSRNRGIEAAAGDYLSFVDPDDAIAPDFYELLYGKAVSGNFDIVKGSRVKVDSLSGKIQQEKINERIRYGLKHGDPLFYLFTYQHQTAIYKKALFADKTIIYGSSRNVQDTTFLLSVCKKTQNIVFEDPAVYYYSARSGSATSAYTEQRCRNELDGLREKIDILLKERLDRYAVRYLDVMLIGYVSNICRGISEGAILNDREAGLTGLLLRQLSRMPEWASGEKDQIELLILARYQRLIPMKNVKPEQFHYDRLQRWTDFLAEHPGLECGRILEGYDLALFRSLISFMLHGRGEFFRTRKHWLFIREQACRLTPKQRKQMIRFAWPALHRILRERIKAFF